jgi:hypothetical protein
MGEPFRLCQQCNQKKKKKKKRKRKRIWVGSNIYVVIMMSCTCDGYSSTGTVAGTALAKCKFGGI